MNQHDILIATGGVSSPLWLPALNQWIALVLGLVSIVYVCTKLWRAWKGK
jgi:hypothetical protein